MNGNHFSLILLSTNKCNAACDYCFEDKTNNRLDHAKLQLLIDKVLDHMETCRIGSLTIHWQGGEAMLLPPDWYRQAFELIQNAALNLSPALIANYVYELRRWKQALQ